MDWTAFIQVFLSSLAAAGLVAWLLITFLKREPPSAAPPPIVPMSGELQQILEQLGGIKEGLSRLPSADALKAVKDRIVVVEERVPGDLTASVDGLKQSLVRIETEYKARREAQERMQTAIHKIEAVFAGTQSRGAAGEGVLAEAFSQFPPEMGETNFKVNGKPVEFALVLPNRKRLPIDSKWPAVKELEQYANTDDEQERSALRVKIEKAVSKKVDEVTKYIDPASTVGSAVAAIPDAAYFACQTAHMDAYRKRVFLMPYSLTVPFLLTIYNLHMQSARSVDMENLDLYLSQIEAGLNEFEDRLENSVAKGATMIQNAYQELRTRVGEIRGALAALRQAPADSLAEKQESLLAE